MVKRSTGAVVFVPLLVLAACHPRPAPEPAPQPGPEAVAQVSWSRAAIVVASGHEQRAAEMLNAEVLDPFTWRMSSPAGERVSLKVLSVGDLGAVLDGLIPEVGDRRIYVRSRCTRVVARPSVTACLPAPAGFSIIEVDGFTQCERADTTQECVETFQKTGELRGYRDAACTQLVTTIDFNRWACSVP